MFDLIIILLAIALLAGALGARSASAVASNIAWVLFIIVLIGWVLRYIL
jgi:uncharacterized membrane protein YtjA (UPF0391 family)